jgi:polyferredoxin
MHQKLRKLSQIVFTILLLPLTLSVIISPLLVCFLDLINFAAAVIIARIALTIWILAFLSSLVFQRAHCSHTCAMTGFFVFLSFVLKRKDILSTRYPKALKYITLILWFGGFTYVLIRWLGNVSGFLEYEPIFSSPTIMFYYMMFSISAGLSLTSGKSKTEHYICPFSPFLITGIKIGEAIKIPSFKFQINKEKCRQCKMCNKVCLMNYDVCDLVAKDEFNQKECLNCAMCSQACKFGAIEYKFYKDQVNQRIAQLTN